MWTFGRLFFEACALEKMTTGGFLYGHQQVFEAGGALSWGNNQLPPHWWFGLAVWTLGASFPMSSNPVSVFSGDVHFNGQPSEGGQGELALKSRSKQAHFPSS